MRRLLLALFILIPWAATASAHADPLFDLKFSGNGHTFEFVMPNPPSRYDVWHGVVTYLYNLPGTEDGTAGYLFDVALPLDYVGLVPSVSLYVAAPGSGELTPYYLHGPHIASALYVPVSYNPNHPFGNNYLLVPSLVPGDYTFQGLVSQNYVPFSLSLTEEQGPVTTPEPSTLVLLVTGMAGASAMLRRRGFAVHTRG